MKKIIVLIAALMMCAATAHATGFTNGGFETGDLSGWTGGGGNWGGYSTPVVHVPYTGGTLPTAPLYNGGTPNNTIMNAGTTDPYTGQNTVYNGQHSVRVNDDNNNYSVSTIQQSMTNYTDTDIYFQWNAVLESSHGPNDSDYFSLTLHDDTAGTDLLTRAYSSATAASIFTYYAGWYGSGWQQEHIDLAAIGAVGHDLTLSLLASDCPYVGHAGYVYLDGFFREPVPPSSVPEPSTMLLLGGGIAGLAFWRRNRKA